jgi:arginine decarboxylase
LATDRPEPALVTDLRAAWAAEQASFHMPGHKGGAGAPRRGIELWGPAIYATDLSEMSGFDYLHSPEAGLRRAQARAAVVFGAERTWFLVNGSTVGNLAGIMAVAHDGDRILVSRASHRSVYAALALSGATPVYLRSAPNPELDGWFGPEPSDLAEALDADQAIRAVHVTSPSYYGYGSDLVRLAEICHHRGLPLLVDEAHGSHLVFSDRLPRPALACGADLVVHSPHKTLGSLTQSSLLHLKGDRIDADAVSAVLQMLQSSSPSALLLLSLDLAIDEMEAEGAARWGQAVELAEGARTQIAALPGLRTHGAEVCGTPGISSADPTKLVVDTSGLGVTAFSAAAWLRDRRGVFPEFADLRRIVFSITAADDRETVSLLVDALGALVSAVGELEALGGAISSLWPHQEPEAPLTPREAARPSTRPVKIDEARAQVAGEMVIPYPPGIPLLVPGERITTEILATLAHLRAAGCRIVGPADPTVATLRCLDISDR